MLIERNQLAEIIAQEVRLRLRELMEAEGDRKPRVRKPRTADAERSPSPKGETPPGPQADIEGDPGSDEAGDGDDGSDEFPDDDGLDPGGNAGEEPSGAVNNEISGKIVQAITIEPHSKALPGAKEVIVSFTDSTDSLRVLVTSGGQVKFLWRGQLHDIP